MFPFLYGAPANLCNLWGEREPELARSDSGGIRTRDPQLRRLLLYPTELPNLTRHFPGRYTKKRAKVLLFFEITKFFIQKNYFLHLFVSFRAGRR